MDEVSTNHTLGDIYDGLLNPLEGKTSTFLVSGGDVRVSQEKMLN